MENKIKEEAIEKFEQEQIEMYNFYKEKIKQMGGTIKVKQ